MNSQHDRTFKLFRLYHQFLRPRGAGVDRLPFLVSRLCESGFILLFRDPLDPGLERYSETEKLTSRKHRDELFKIVMESLK